MSQGLLGFRYKERIVLPIRDTFISSKWGFLYSVLTWDILRLNFRIAKQRIFRIHGITSFEEKILSIQSIIRKTLNRKVQIKFVYLNSMMNYQSLYYKCNLIKIQEKYNTPVNFGVETLKPPYFSLDISCLRINRKFNL